ncbi:MAG: diacylglycerol kinase family protein [Methanobrevibacter sp.]|nr:diacylglycerol kinase family protein [Methanobrevibacter sp.]
MKQLINSFKHATEGIITTICVEQNVKIQVLAMICTVILGLVLKLSQIEWIICILLFGGVISAEMFNTSLEKTLDYINTEYDEKIKFIKDASAGAVLVLANTSTIIGLIIFIPKIISSI